MPDEKTSSDLEIEYEMLPVSEQLDIVNAALLRMEQRHANQAVRLFETPDDRSAKLDQQNLVQKINELKKKRDALQAKLK